MTRARLSGARLYVCTDARSTRGDLADFLDAILLAGVDIVQMRDKSLSEADELRALAVVKDRCETHGALWAVNDRVHLALETGAPIVHVGQGDMPVTHVRELLGAEVIIGQSTHSRAQAKLAASNPDVDYFALGPIWETPTKPGRPAIGLHVVSDFAEDRASQAKPWFAIGGINAENITEVRGAGATRVVVVRAVTEASNPAAAAQTLRAAVAVGVS